MFSKKISKICYINWHTQLMFILWPCSSTKSMVL